jgi:hypothetical protein
MKSSKKAGNAAKKPPEIVTANPKPSSYSALVQSTKAPGRTSPAKPKPQSPQGKKAKAKLSSPKKAAKEPTSGGGAEGLDMEESIPRVESVELPPPSSFFDPPSLGSGDYFAPPDDGESGKCYRFSSDHISPSLLPLFIFVVQF